VASQEQPSAYGVEPATREPVSLLAVLRRRALIVIAVTILAGAAAAAFAYATRNTYESTAKVLFSQTIGPELNFMGALPTSLDADNLAQSNVDVVGSRRVAAPTAAELRRRGVDISAEEVTENVTVTSERDSDVVDVVATASSARDAALLADVYARTAVRLAELDDRREAERAIAALNRLLRELPREQRRATVGPGARLQSDIEQMQVLAEIGNGFPRIIQPGFVPTSKSGNPLQTILLGLLFGVVLGVGLALLRDQADRRLHRAEDVSAAFDAPILTTVPRHRQLKRHPRFAELPPEVGEAFRMLYAQLRFGTTPPVRSVLVTSARSREGKTTVAWNLASAAASGGAAVAFVEADLRRPSVAQRYGLESAPGLAEVLRGDISVASALQTVPTLPGDAGANGRLRPLHVLVAGHPPPDPWNLMHSSAVARVLGTVARDHELVVIDTPPIPHVADAIALLRRVDGVIVTASVNSTRGPEAGRLRDQLQALDARVIGVVANGGSAARGYAYGSTPPASDRVSPAGGPPGAS
jgi:polysaccharide biosynthesis transport protein